MTTQQIKVINFNSSDNRVTILDSRNPYSDIDFKPTYKLYQIVSKAEHKTRMLKTNVLNLMQDCFIYKSNSEINVKYSIMKHDGTIEYFVFNTIADSNVLENVRTELNLSKTYCHILSLIEK